jgi:hypothetical protein
MSAVHPYVKRPDANIMTQGTVMLAPADAGLNPDDKG